MSPLSHLRVSDAVTPENHASYVTITLFILASLNLLFYCFRLFARWPLAELFSYDDALATGATFISLCQCIATGVAVTAGLGHYSTNLLPESLQKVHTAVFAGDILYVIALCLAKMACALLIYRLSPTGRNVRLVRIACAAILLWGIVSIIVISVPVGSQNIWQTGPELASKLLSRWTAVAVMSMLLDAALLIFPIFLIRGVKISTANKVSIVAAFDLRCCVLVFAGLRLATLYVALRSSDYSSTMVMVTVYTQFEMHASIISASIPTMKTLSNALNASTHGATPEHWDQFFGTTKGCMLYTVSRGRFGTAKSQPNRACRKQIGNETIISTDVNDVVLKSNSRASSYKHGSHLSRHHSEDSRDSEQGFIKLEITYHTETSLYDLSLPEEPQAVSRQNSLRNKKYHRYTPSLPPTL